jgi:hypothetical protein
MHYNTVTKKPSSEFILHRSPSSVVFSEVAIVQSPELPEGPWMSLPAIPVSRFERKEYTFHDQTTNCAKLTDEKSVTVLTSPLLRRKLGFGWNPAPGSSRILNAGNFVVQETGYDESCEPRQSVQGHV